MEQPAKGIIKQELKVKEKENVEIRDSLAIERTKLANERTFLAYIRTAMTLVLAGFSLMNFFQENFYVWAGAVFIPVGIVIGLVGLRKFVQKRETIGAHTDAYTPTSQMHAQVVKKEIKTDAG